MDRGPVILMDQGTREIFALWLKGRERVKAIEYSVWFGWLAGTRIVITEDEIQILSDVCGSSILDILRISAFGC